MTNLKQLFIDRIASQGVERSEFSALLRDLALILTGNRPIDPKDANQRLRNLGWHDVRLDYQSLQLALALMEREAVT